ncbi:hypothetical protein [Undibacterium crateris]|uniref:hypothetical protein n=1 Tax=Undibacterium crateris TaxID=2528175 RepID=UPI001389B0E0|nr:hypothetical protein [Undibacterium crateris]NDI85093.1 hypothetical protein [Undibacterium crateris]
MITTELYKNAECAAVWMARGDDFKEADAIRKLISEHKEMKLTLEKIANSGNDGGMLPGQCISYANEAITKISRGAS